MDDEFVNYQVEDYLTSASTNICHVIFTVNARPEHKHKLDYTISLLQVKRDLEKLIRLEKEYCDRT